MLCQATTTNTGDGGGTKTNDAPAGVAVVAAGAADVLSYAMLCYVMLFCVVLCYATLCYALPYCAVLRVPKGGALTLPTPADRHPQRDPAIAQPSPTPGEGGWQ
jgi:hypothetical protein